MSENRPTRGGLAITFLSTIATVGLLTVLAAGVVSIVQVYRLSTQTSVAEDRRIAQMVEDRVESRLANVITAVDRSALLATEATSSAQIGHDLAVVYDSNSGIVDGLFVVDSLGVPIARAPSGDYDVAALAEVFTRAIQGRTGFVTLTPENGRGWDLWVSRNVVGSDGAVKVVLAQVETDFVESALRASLGPDSSRSALLVQDDTVLAGVGDDAPSRLTDIVWTAGNGGGSGSLRMVTPDGIEVSGAYTDINAPEGSAWRVLVLQPPLAGVGETIATVTPVFVVVLVGGVVGLGAAWTVSRRFVRPLVELERAARTAASGSYVKPLQAVGEDEVARVATAFNDVALRLNALHDLSQLLASAASFDQVIDGILSSMRHLVGPGKAVAYLLDSAGETLVPVRARGVDIADLAPVPLDAGSWLARALNAVGMSELEGDADEVRRELPALADGESCAVAAPLVAGHDPLGLVVVLKTEGASLSEAEREMLRTFSAQAAVAVQTSRLFEIESRSRRIAESLRAIAEELVSTAGFEESFGRVREIVRTLFEAVSVHLVVVDPHAVGLDASRDRDFDDRLIALSLRLLESRAHGVHAIVNDRTPGGDDGILAELEAAELLVVPVALESDHGALLAIALPRTGSGAEEYDLAEAVADEIALALDNAYLYERAVARAHNLETIFRISQVVGSPLQVNVVLNRVMDVVQKILSADGVALAAFDPRRRALTTSMVRGRVPLELVQADYQPGSDIPGKVYESGEPVIIRNLKSDDESGVPEAAAALGLRSLVAVPLLARSRSIGVLLVFSEEAGAFSEEDVNLLQTFASQAALAIDTARLYSREHEVATVLQQSILPDELPLFDEVDSGSIYIPVGPDNEIGGDYYDLFRGPDGDIWMVIADVCGKGIHAATKTSMIKYAVRALVAAGMSPGGVMREVNRMVAESGAANDIMTAWVGRFRPNAADIVYASGGHPPAMVKRPDGSRDRLMPTGPLLGAIPDVSYAEESVPFAAEARILLYTDGVTEARQGNTFYGEDRLWDAFLCEGTAQESARRVLEDIRAFSRGSLRDDVAVLCITALCGDGQRTGGEQDRDADDVL